MRLGLFLETIAVVPGIVATIVRYAKDFLGIDHDKDWLYTTIQESQVERIHLLSWMELYNPNVIVRMLILGMQTMVFWMVMLCYILSPSFCHRFVGYLEELTLEKYTDLVAEVDDSRLSTWATQEAPLVAKDYWKMKDDANIRDMLLELRADEARHRDINHTFASIATKQNPFLEHPKASWISI
jgi:hypothetical protein